MVNRLSTLQARILRVIAGVEPAPVLTGGAALAGFHTRHRSTRDVDAFWRDRRDLDDIPEIVLERLSESGLAFSVLQRTPAFLRARVVDGDDVCLLDLVAEPVPALEAPEYFDLGGVRVAVDSAHEILVNKLCTLLERAELRDLVDVAALLDAGGDLDRALADAPRKDGGFSPLTLAWVLETTPFQRLASTSDLDVPTMDRLMVFRASLISRLTLR